MKVLGRSETGFIVSLSREELDALYVRSYEYRGDIQLGVEVDVISRLRPTIKFEESAAAGSLMASHLREMADELEKGLASLRS